MENTKEIFKNAMAKEFTKNFGKTSNVGGMMQDMMKYSKEMKEEESLKGGKADKMNLNDIAKKHGITLIQIAKAFIKGFNIELEHTKDQSEANEIVMDHLYEDPKYYDKLKKVESKEGVTDLVGKVKMKKPIGKMVSFGKSENKEATGSGSSGAYVGPLFGGDDKFIKKSESETPKLKEGLATGAMGLDKVEATEATGSGSVGGYVTPSAWAKTTKKKDWGPSRKTQIPGGGFVKVKKKCTRFPYCNQGDINALKITKNESVKEAIKKVSIKTGISEKVISSILEHEYNRIQKKK